MTFKSSNVTKLRSSAMSSPLDRTDFVSEIGKVFSDKISEMTLKFDQLLAV